MHAAGPRRERWMVSAAGLVGLVVIVTGVVMSGPPAPDPGTGSGAIAAGHHEPDPASAPPATVAPATDPGSPSASGASMAPPSTSPPPPDTGPFPGGVLVADRGNHRILVLDDRGRIVWRFPERGSLPAGWASVSADDAFLAPDGRSIVANDESHETIVRIDLTSRRVVWTYGRYGRPGGATGLLHTPDDAYPLANGDIVVADIENCRILEIAPSHRIVHQWGRTGVCVDDPPCSFARPNGDTPLPDGGLLVTEITGSRVVRLAADGHVVFDIHVPVAYPSDAQLDAAGNVVVADYSTIGQVVAVNPATGRLVWRWRFTGGIRRLDHPSLATPLANGDVSVNDDFRQRVIVIDPRTMRIVWQFGRTDHAGAGGSSLDVPDGHQPLPAIGPF
jgi:outer membrane protein assembly factor BamB